MELSLLVSYIYDDVEDDIFKNVIPFDCLFHFLVLWMWLVILKDHVGDTVDADGILSLKELVHLPPQMLVEKMVVFLNKIIKLLLVQHCHLYMGKALNPHFHKVLSHEKALVYY